MHYLKKVTGSTGSWRESEGTLYLTNKKYKQSTDNGITWTSWKPSSSEANKISHGSSDSGDYIVINGLRYYKGSWNYDLKI